MRRLLLLFILSPVVLFGQSRRNAIVDSFKAATNLRDVSAIINNYSDTKVEHLQVSDSGEYVTIVVKVHVSDGRIAALTLLPPGKVKQGDVVAGVMSTVIVPPVPDPVAEPLTPHAFNQFKIDAAVAGDLESVTVPPLPSFSAEALPPLAVTLIRVSDFVAIRVDAVIVPPVPDVVWETDAIPLLAAINLPIENHSARRLDTVESLVFEEKKMAVTEMHLSDNGYSLLEKMEGFSPEPYSLGDGGLTIGFGFFVPDGQGSKWKGMTWEEAETIIRQKMPAYEDQVKRYINVPLTQEEFDALTMMAYNLGGFSKATSIVNDINSNADLEQLQKDWMRFVHSKAPGVMKGLMNRRKDEIQVRGESNYQPERKIQIFKNRK